MAALPDLAVTMLTGDETDFGALTSGKATLVVNVASRCGLTKQYEQLEALHRELSGSGFMVLGFPCNQFGEQEPGSADEIAEFCSATYGVTFPMSEKIDVNGADRNPVYAELTKFADASGTSGDIRWNFEKFLVTPDGRVVGRFPPQMEPSALEIRTAIEDVLPDSV